MKGAHVLKLAGMAALLTTGACQSTEEAVERGPYTRYSVAPSAQPLTPILVVSVPDIAVPTGPRTNQLGGEIPQAKPTRPVEDYGLGEIR